MTPLEFLVKTFLGLGIVAGMLMLYACMAERERRRKERGR